MSNGEDLLRDSAEELFEDAPCGYLSTDIEGKILRVNRTFERWTGRPREHLLGGQRFQDLLSVGGRVYYETHYFPLLQMQDEAKQIAVDVMRVDGSRLPAVIDSVLHRDAEGAPLLIKTTVFDMTDRRAYEHELQITRRREKNVAEELQRSLLSGELPSTPALDIAVSYRPGVAGLQVGGDWYDAFWLDQPDTVGLVVGDVVGRGLEAATNMGQLRSAIRALALSGVGPAALLEALDRYSDRYGVGYMATVVYAQLQLGANSLRFACAGHPPPLLLSPGQPPSYNWEGRSVPLNMRLGAQTRTEVALTLPPDSTVLFYTDGLVEQPMGPPDHGMDRLLVEVAEHRAEPTEQLASSIVRALHNAEHRDDVCLLIAGLNNQAGG
jgi:sigma-B regulation protein RsbU (phosphoserine phosphatase)